MSKVKIQGNASGTGVLTVTAPNTSTDRTITLPDSTGTLATTADVPAGITSSADGTAITIDSSERVGIGTGSPTARLHVYNANDHVRLSAQCAQNTGQHWQFQSRNNGEFWIRNETTGSNKFIMDSTGAVTMSSQPAFLATANGSSQTNVCCAETVNFGTEVFDQNSDYNNSTSVFTAPVTGRYNFSGTVRTGELDTNSSFYRIEIQTSNRTYKFGIIDIDKLYSADPLYHSFHFNTLADMDSGDTASVVLIRNGGTATADISGASEYSFFSGHLVC